MRFEAKHSYFKQLARYMGNFINLPISLAMRHQQLQCYQNVCDSNVSRRLVIGPGKLKCLNLYNYYNTYKFIGEVVIQSKLQEVVPETITNTFL